MIEAGNELGDRAFPAAGGAHKGDSSTRLDVQRKVFYERRVELGIAEGDISQLYRASELVVILVLADGRVGETGILRVLHHVLHALHLRPHFLERLSRGDQCHGGAQKGGKEALERRDHAEGELTAHTQPDSQHKHQRVCKGGDKGGNDAEVLIEPCVLRVLLIDGSLIARPALEISVLRAAGLDGLHHADAGHGGAHQLAGVPCLHTGNVDALFGDNPAHDNVDKDTDKTYQRQKRTAAQHHDEVEHHHHSAERQRRQRIYQLLGDGLIGLMPCQEIARHALGEELHRHFENLPHEGAAADDRHLAVYFQ